MLKIFAHRGFVGQNAKENSIESLDLAVQEKFDGVEFDVWFVDGKLVVNHDKPSSIKGLPSFSDYLKHRNKLEYWIDFKNLEKISQDDLLEAIKIVKLSIDKALIDKEKIYLAPFITNLSKACEIYQKIREIFGDDAQIMAVCDKISKENAEKLCDDLRKNAIKFLSINHKNIDENFMKYCDGITLFAWTVNDLQVLEYLKKLGVRNFTSDKFTPTDL